MGTQGRGRGWADGERPGADRRTTSGQDGLEREKGERLSGGECPEDYGE